VVNIVRRRFCTRAVGHTGTLDPFATGLLILVLGPATRLARFVTAARKTYLATARLGWRTATDDADGQALGSEWRDPWPSREAVETALAGLVGEYPQTPPSYSAKRIGGVRSHVLARRGGSVAPPPATVMIERLDLLEWAPPLVTFRALVGPGAYVRAIARDLGDRLETGAHLTVLRRERVGRFEVAEAYRLDGLIGTEALLPPTDLVAELRRVDLEPEAIVSVRHGRSVGQAAESGTAALVGSNQLVAIAEARGGRWQPVVVLPEG